MVALSLTCPSCGAPASIQDRFTKLFVCGYCGQTCVVTDGRLDPRGKVATLATLPSQFSTGAKGVLREAPFTVMGRIRFSYDDGIWDEWLLYFDDGKTVWIEEDEGEIISHSKTRITAPLPSFESIKVGSVVAVNEISLFVTEKREATLAGAEGQMPFTFTPGEVIRCVDGNAAGGIWAIEWTDAELVLSRGEIISPSEISVS